LILIACNTNQIFRHSFTADYYLYDIASKKIKETIRFSSARANFSPDGKK
jgi:dipeptidyl-peptidase-4